MLQTIGLKATLPKAMLHSFSLQKTPQRLKKKQLYAERFVHVTLIEVQAWFYVSHIQNVELWSVNQTSYLILSYTWAKQYKASCLLHSVSDDALDN